MGYEDIIRDGVAIASSEFETMKLDVVHTPWIGDNGRGVDAYGTPQNLRALVNKKHKQMHASSGNLVTVVMTLLFLENVASTSANTGKTRTNPFDIRDKFSLSDGTTAPTVDVDNGVIDSGRDQGFVTKAWLGHAQ